MRLAILTTHPIQYYAPWFRHLATRFDLEVLYAYRQDAQGQAAAGFGVEFEWDVPLLEGYRYRWLKNVSGHPGLKTFGGCDTPELFDLIRPENYDALLVLGWNKKSLVQGIRAAWRHGVPILMRGDSQLQTQRSGWKRALKYPLYRWFLPRIDAHLYVGQRNKEYLEHYGIREEQLFFSPHFVDNDFFASRAEEARKTGAAREIRDQFRIPHQAAVSLFVGKFIEKKRPGDFVAAALHVAAARNDFHAVLVGDGPLRTELQEVAGANPRQIHFAGFRNQSELPAFYAAADNVVLPSDASETWGLVVNEAMASGIPAIVSDAAGCAPDLIDEGATGWSFPLGDVEGLALRLNGFAADILLVSQADANARRMRVTRSEALRRRCGAYSMERATEALERACQAMALEN
jgi:glycosyltransferase involved in cell wall biosynthesis